MLLKSTTPFRGEVRGEMRCTRETDEKQVGVVWLAEAVTFKVPSLPYAGERPCHRCENIVQGEVLLIRRCGVRLRVAEFLPKVCNNRGPVLPFWEWKKSHWVAIRICIYAIFQLDCTTTSRLCLYLLWPRQFCKHTRAHQPLLL